MKKKSKLIDAFLILISAWAAVATSMKGDYQATHPLESGQFSVQSTCEDAARNQGEITVSPRVDGNYSFSAASDFGFPTDFATEVVLDSKDEEESRIISLAGDTRICQTETKDELFNIPGSIPFLCFDNKSQDVACTITLKLLYLKEESAESESPEPAPPVEEP